MSETISYDELKLMVDNKSKFILLDVRERHELLNGILPSAKNLPLSEIESAINLEPSIFFRKYGFKISKDVLIVTYCRTGKRSEKASELLEKNDFQVKNFSGSVQEWSKYDAKVRMY